MTKIKEKKRGGGGKKYRMIHAERCRCHVQIGYHIPYTGSFILDKYRSHFKLKLSTLFISLYDKPSSAASLAR